MDELHAFSSLLGFHLNSPSTAAQLVNAKLARLNRGKTFDFFEPLDEQFIPAIAAYARSHGFAYMSLFDGRAFFSYLPWTPQRDADPYAEVMRQDSQMMSQNMRRLAASGAGRAYQSAIG